MAKTIPASNGFDNTEIMSLNIESAEDTGLLCDRCQIIRKDYGSYHHKPMDLMDLAASGCPCCKLIVDEVDSRFLTSNRHSRVVLGTKSDIIYKIFEYNGRWGDDLNLRFEFFRQRGQLPPSILELSFGLQRHVLNIKE